MALIEVFEGNSSPDQTVPRQPLCKPTTRPLGIVSLLTLKLPRTHLLQCKPSLGSFSVVPLYLDP